MLLLCSHGEAKIAFLSAINVIGISFLEGLVSGPQHVSTPDNCSKQATLKIIL